MFEDEVLGAGLVAARCVTENASTSCSLRAVRELVFVFVGGAHCEAMSVLATARRPMEEDVTLLISSYGGL